MGTTPELDVRTGLEKLATFPYQIASWVDDDLRICYQVMETDDRALLDAWMAAWDDLVAFEVHPVMTSAEAAARIAPSL